MANQILRNLVLVGVIAGSVTFGFAQSSTNAMLGRLSLPEAIDLALQQNPAILRARKDVEAATGVQIQTRAVVYPKLRATGNYEAVEPDSVDRPNLSQFTFGTDQSWAAGIRVVQSLYEGGRLASAWRSGRLIRERSLLQYQAVLADTILAVEQAYNDVLLAKQRIVVQEESVQLLTRELQDTERRFAAGTLPRFNVLRAEVELANAKPALIRARNALVIARNTLVNQLGLPIQASPEADNAVELTGQLEAQRLDISLPDAIRTAWERRPEIMALARTEALRQEDVVRARSGYKPQLQAFAGYQARSSMFDPDLSSELHGWVTGVQASWDLYDGGNTRGRVREAEALRERAGIETDDARRRIELEVRTEHARFIEAGEVLVSQDKVEEQSQEALRLATARYEAGTGTQLDVLSAQTALTDARSTRLQALHDHAMARARLVRAAALNIPQPVPKG